MATAKGGLAVAIKFTPQAQSDNLTLSEDQLNDGSQSLSSGLDPSQNVLANDGGGAGVQIMGIVAGNAVDAVKGNLAAYVDLNNFSTPKAGYTQAMIGSGDLAGSVMLSNGGLTYVPAHDISFLSAGETAVVGTFTYIIRMGNGAFSVTTATITLVGDNDAPVARADVASVQEDSIFVGSVATNDHDVDHLDVLSFTLNNPVDGLTFNSDGSYSFDAGHQSYQHLAAGNTALVVTSYTVSGGHGGKATATLSITVTGTNDKPVAAVDSVDGKEDATITGSVAGNDTDADDGAVLSYAVVGQTPVGFTLDADGSYTLDASNVAYQHLAKDALQDLAIGYTVTDEHGASSQSTLTIHLTGVNDKPVAAADAADVNEDSTLTGSVAGNDTDADDGAVLSYAVVGQTPVGFTLDADGSYTLDASNVAYQHLAKDALQDLAIGYTVTDEHGASSQSTLTIHLTGVNDKPVAAADAADVNEDSTLTGSVAGNDTDPDDGAALTFSMTDNIAGLTFHADGSYSFDAGNAAYQSLNAGQKMDVVANYSVTDENGATSASTLTITVHGANEALPPPDPTKHTTTVQWSVDGKTDPNDGHLDLLGANWSNFHLSVNGTGDFDWKNEGINLTGDATASYRGPNAQNSTGNSSPESQLNFSTGNVTVSIDTAKLADGFFDYDLTLTEQTSDKSVVNLTFTYDYWA